MRPFHSLKSRITIFFVTLLALVQGFAFLLVNAANTDNARESIRKELISGERIFQRLLEQNRNQLVQGASILSGDFAFREAIATNDSSTLASVLKNHGARIHASRMMLVSLENNLLADTMHGDNAARPFPFPKLLDSAREHGQASTTLLIENRPYQIVVVPVKAPLPIAWLAMGFEVDDKLTEDLRALTGLQVSFLHREGNKSWTVLASTLPNDLRGALTKGLNDSSVKDDLHLSLAFADSEYETGVIQLEDHDNQKIVAVLQRSLDEALETFTRLRAVLITLAIVSLIVSIAGGVLIAGSVTSPLAELTAGAEKIQKGNYSEPIELIRNDEVGILAKSLNHMREDIAKREKEILRLAYEDILTGLPNRAMFNDRLLQTLRLAKRTGSRFSVLMMDLDRFKVINDTLGHTVGDEVIKQVATRLKNLLRESDTVARLGGDEYGVLLPLAGGDNTDVIVNKIVNTLEEPIVFDGQPLDVGASIGIASYPEHGEEPDLLVRRADMAMYLAKRTNIGFATYAYESDSSSQGQLSLLGELRHAIEQNELLLHYQPKIDLTLGSVSGAEALVRWQHPKRGFVPPNDFIPFAERTGYVRAVTRWVIEATLRQCKEWQAENIILPISINISTRDLLNPELPEIVKGLLQKYGVDANLVCFEITESGIMEDPNRALQTLTGLDALGVRLSIDDYGTGYSSLAYLKKLPVDEMKIDRAFVLNMTEDNDDFVIVRSTVELAHNLGLKVVAEGVETKVCLERLRELGCDHAQGYFMSKPLPPDKLRVWLKEWAWEPAKPETI